MLKYSIMINKKSLSEADIIAKYIRPAITEAGWQENQIRQEFSFTAGRVFVKGKKTVRGEKKRADILLYYKPNIPIAVVEAKDNNHSISDGIQQALGYAETLDLPVAISSNGDGWQIHYRNKCNSITEETRELNQFPTFNEIYQCYKIYKGIETPEEERINSQDYYYDGSGMTPRYYQQIAINRTVEAISKGQKRILLVMATGTGKTYTSFQIIYRLWKSGTKKRILFLVDRTNLIDQTNRGDFKHFGDKLTVVRKKKIDKAFEIYLALYQGLTNYDEDADAYKEFSPDFFDLVVVDECHRGSAADDSEWRKILEYFSNATQIGMTATPKETETISSSEYFGDPIYTYSLKQGIDDGFLAPYKVLRVGINVDLEGWRPDSSTRDRNGEEVEDRLYNIKDYDRNLVIDERTKLVAKKVIEYLAKTNPLDKTIVFCIDTEHALRMRDALWMYAPKEWAEKSDKYIVRITGNEKEAKSLLYDFTNVESPYPVIAATSKLMSTGTDAKTCKLIVLDSNIGSMTEFKQIIGRGTRICEEYDKLYFTIMDFRNVTDKFSDKDFDGDPVRIKKTAAEDEFTEEDLSGDDGEPQIDPLTGKEVDFGDSSYAEIRDGFGTCSINSPEPEPYGQKKEKIYVAGIDVSILNERQQYLDANGKLITESMISYTKRSLKNRFRSLSNFLNEWNEADKKQAVIQELEKQGIILENLNEAVKANLDPFDLICHLAFDTPALTRKERAENVKKRNAFTKYGEQAGKVLEALLEKYAESGIENIEDMTVLNAPPLPDFGTPTEIVKWFGGKDSYKKAIKELEKEIYRDVA